MEEPVLRYTMVQWRNGQMSLGDGFWAREVGDLWAAWMRVADRLLEDEELIDPIYQAQGSDGSGAVREDASRPRLR